MALLLFLIILGFTPPAPSRTTVKTQLDSATLLMGRITGLDITIVKPQTESGYLLIPSDTLASGVEIVGESKADTQLLGNGIQEIKRQLIIQSFDSGLYTLSPILYVSATGDTSISNREVLKVVPVNVDSLQTIHDYADVQDGEKKFWDFLPDFLTDWGIWMIIAILLAVAGIVVYFRYFKNGIKNLQENKRTEPPYEQAIRRLKELKSRKLCESGREKEYYTELTDILRTYIDRRFHINAMEMTSSDILNALDKNDDTRLPKRHMKLLLEVADFVKFAAQRPLPDDNVRAYNNALQFVEDTKPSKEVFEPESKTNTQ